LSRDQFAFALSIDEVVKNRLKRGLNLSNEQITNLKDLDETEYVYAKLLNFLSYRPHSVKEVRDRLYKYKVNEVDKQNILINKLKSKGYLDDIAFASWFIQSRNKSRPRSKHHLSAELKNKGIGSDIIQALSSQIDDESVTIKRLLDKKLGIPRKLEISEKQKITNYLARQGFAWNKISEVVKSWESE